MDNSNFNVEIDNLSAEFFNFMENSYTLFKVMKNKMNSNEFTKLEVLRDDIDNFVTELTNFLEEQDD